MPNGTIIVRLPYPHKVGFVTFFIKRDVGFSFNQRAIFNLLQNNKIDLPNHSKWLKDTDKNVVLLETLYAGAQSYKEGLREKDNFTKVGLSKALNECSKSKLQSIVDCWIQSEQLGHKKLPGKKKVVKS